MRKKNRVKRNEDFTAVFQKGKSIANRQFVIYQLPKVEQVGFRLGISVSKKLGNAVTRNHIKRYIRQVFTECKTEIKGQRDYVIIARKPCVELTYEEFYKSLLHALKKAESIEGKRG
ncbi:ribonuclease P protein component [Priestia taiwanensis]|uniref:Ribonuclease P protein component n=1 Tax=Priestia taiwanensis TaxID=1347902 RepID=A0A917AY26_9BACI|nr:ribonuclease P protein component [Priestia taiwanensis]MBM7364846.1 ribonuclease P protein component [Priestia taiwanensis]GGE83213.1 ribonuclease P protein component [Priestia taiwanensis]